MIKKIASLIALIGIFSAPATVHTAGRGTRDLGGAARRIFAQTAELAETAACVSAHTCVYNYQRFNSLPRDTRVRAITIAAMLAGVITGLSVTSSHMQTILSHVKPDLDEAFRQAIESRNETIAAEIEELQRKVNNFEELLDNNVAMDIKDFERLQLEVRHYCPWIGGDMRMTDHGKKRYVDYQCKERGGRDALCRDQRKQCKAKTKRGK